ncbi:MAG: hydrogenase expression/formation protein HypE [Methylococcales bacterium]|nr:hydrogenase expression/formation protein HypE [Methylococcales bacterium]
MSDFTLSCPTPLHYEQIVLAHGGGGRLMQQLLDSTIQPIFNNTLLKQKTDCAVFSIGEQKLAFTTDSYVINPVFFAGGDIGKLAVCGTLNDLAMSGAKPLYLSCGLILEEGFAISDLKRVLQSMQETAQAAGVSIVTGDTKVVDRGKGDGIYINTAGIGLVAPDVQISPQRIQVGDSIIINSDIARHGMAIMLAREGVAFESQIESDCADLSELVQTLIAANIDLHCLRDLTRGGLASGLLELAENSNQQFSIQETTIPIHENVQSACEILGFDPLYVANEACFVLFVSEEETEKTLNLLRSHPLGSQAQKIGTVTDIAKNGAVILETAMGVNRQLTLLSGEQLPRIC